MVGSQNARRAQALNDPYNFIACTIMSIVVHGDADIPLDLRIFFNSDKSSSLLNESVILKILSGLGIKEELDELNRNVTITKTGNEEQKRGIAYSLLSQAVGECLAWTTHIKDHCWNDRGTVCTYRLDKTNWLQTIPTSCSSASNETLAEQEANQYINLIIFKHYMGTPSDDKMSARFQHLFILVINFLVRVVVLLTWISSDGELQFLAVTGKGN